MASEGLTDAPFLHGIAKLLEDWMMVPSHIATIPLGQILTCLL